MLAGHVGLAIAGILFSRYLQYINATRFHIGRSVETKALAAESMIRSLKPMSQICSPLLDMQSPNWVLLLSEARVWVDAEKNGSDYLISGRFARSIFS
ncbi:hypothetical protein DTO166G4_6780 [Paecilomyces variotii]|nr:hypothetical protein DTO166G4_6780 [Paecilomyces variotii]KAJ9238678.1 hypothetical protein DTO166G5_2799 [Paecilomyces variotii]KAJ9364439.1 hypothetical protein DTO280E4_1685 [Paecilomyces variotii]